MEGLKATSEVVGGDEVGEMLPELVVRFVMIAFDGHLLDRPVHPFDLAVRPRVTWLGEAVFDVEVDACGFEGMAAERQLLCPHFLDVFRRPAIAGRVGEMRPIVGEHDVDPVRHGCGEMAQKVTGDPAGGFFMEFVKGELGRPVDGHQQVEFALLSPYLGKIDVEVTDRIRLELLSGRLVAIDVGHPTDAMTLQAAVKRGARQMRDPRL